MSAQPLHNPRTLINRWSCALPSGADDLGLSTGPGPGIDAATAGAARDPPPEP